MDHYHTAIEALVDPIHDRHKNALLQGDMESAIYLEAARNAIHQQIFAARLRSEDIIHWLKFDAELRQVGETYPDAMEGSIKVGVFDESY
ncbi:hypothetical protein [Nostoc sp. TCL240-02]|uniref:hypothetical protein n=1 Tax=Nostoc sp. TCL240-02 TaxID=2572090 RepID=UPI00157F828F|nr:hypothetical protein [Nostoc sp. TCL240-02]QKQ75576.1 hypothetical protein FBB35_21835 [Nostoc sp. TCL240-02]